MTTETKKPTKAEQWAIDNDRKFVEISRVNHVRCECDRCSGTGAHGPVCVLNGVCFKCSGHGYTYRKLQNVYNSARRAEKKGEAAEAKKTAWAELTARYGWVSEHEVSYAAKQASERFAKERKAIEQETQEYVGTIGKREEFRVTLEAIITFDVRGYSYYASVVQKHLHVFKTASGDRMVWFASSGAMENDKVGETFVIKATVKKHDIYKKTGDKQTTVNRVKLA